MVLVYHLVYPKAVIHMVFVYHLVYPKAVIHMVLVYLNTVT